ncbi:unnamed protein product, partial [Scytosiphon promiscuus]
KRKQGYHPGTIGRVNDDGSLYVKLDDGDSEWSVPSQQIIPTFPYMPATTPTRSDGRFENTKDRAATPESPGGVGAHGKRDELDSQRGETRLVSLSKDASTSPCASVVPRPAKAVSGARREHPTEARASPDKAMVATSSPSKKESEDCGGGDEEGADGVSWIAELANSVGVPSPAARSSPAAPHDAAGGDGGDGGGEGSGLDWITDLVAFFPVPGTAAQAPGNTQTAAGVGSSERLSVSHAAPARTPTATDAALATSSGPGTPAATTTLSPRAVTPTHLEWKPIKDGSSPPRLSRSTGSSAFSSAAASAAPADVRTTKAAVTTSTPPLSPWPQDAETAPDSNAGGPRRKLTISVSEDTPSERGPGSGAGVSPLHLGGESTAATTPAAGGAGPPGCDARAGDDETQGSANGDTTAPGRNPAGSRGDQGAPAPGIVTRGLSAETLQPPEEGSRALNSGDVGDPHNALAPLQGKVTTPRHAGSPESTRWEVLRSSVQRRYAAEAMHLSEEVRLLSAKLEAADDKAEKRLAQQQRVIAAQMEEVLIRERDKAEALLSTERASSARRINARQVEVISTQRAGAARQVLSVSSTTHGHNVLRGRRSTLSPPLQYNTTGVRGRARAGNTSSSSQRGGSRVLPNTALGRREASTRRPRSASSAAKASSLPLEISGRSEGGRTCVERNDRSVYPERSDGGPLPLTSLSSENARGGSGGGGDGRARDDTARDRFPEESLIEGFLTRATGLASSDGSKTRGQDPGARRHPEHRGGGRRGAKDRDTGPATPPPRRQAQDAPILEQGPRHREESLRWRLEMERKETRRRLEAMKSEVERVVGQFRTRTERAEAAAASAERRAAVKALRYLRSKRSASPPPRG